MNRITTLLTEHPKTSKTLEIIGKLLGPAGIITILGPIFDADNHTTAIVSLLTILLAAIMLWSHQVNKIPTYYVLLTMISLIALFFLGFKNIIFKDTGLIKYWKETQGITDVVKEKIEASKEEMWFYGTSFYISAKQNRKLILKKLSEGVNVYYLVFNLKSPLFNAVAADFGQDSTTLFEECKPGFRILCSLNTEWNSMKNSIKTPGSLEIRFYNEIPRLRAYIFDPRDRRSNCFYTPYMNNMDSPNLPAFQFFNDKDGVFNDYFEPIKSLWKKSQKLEDILVKHSDLDSLSHG